MENFKSGSYTHENYRHNNNTHTLLVKTHTFLFWHRAPNRAPNLGITALAQST